jgi:hypothetical protein
MLALSLEQPYSFELFGHMVGQLLQPPYVLDKRRFGVPGQHDAYVCGRVNGRGKKRSEEKSREVKTGEEKRKRKERRRHPGRKR